MKCKIPKIIHQIWIGWKKPPLWCIDSWRIQFCNKYPEWEYKLWRESDIDSINLVNRNIYDKEPTLRGKSDIARYEILYQYGGIFLDTDSYWIDNKKNFNYLFEIELGNSELFCGNEPKNKELFANGVIGCTINNNIMLTMINYLNSYYLENKKKNNHKYDIWKVSGPVPFTKIIKDYLKENDDKEKIKIFQSEYFFPESYHTNNQNIDTNNMNILFPNSYMYQYWLSHTDYYKE